MDKNNKQLYIFMVLLEFPIAANLKGSLEVAILLTAIGILSYFYIKPFIFLKEKIPFFKLYFFGAYFLGGIIATYLHYSNLSIDAVVGLFTLLNIILLPFIYKVKKEIDSQSTT